MKKPVTFAAFAVFGAISLTGTHRPMSSRSASSGRCPGPMRCSAKNFKMGIDAWVAEHGNKVGNHEVEFIYRDEESPNPAKSKALAQELLVKDKVQYLAGLYFTPDAMAVAPLLEEIQDAVDRDERGDLSHRRESPYIVRTSFTMWQNTVPAAKVAQARTAAKKVAIAVSDYGPGIDAEAAFKKTFEAEGGADGRSDPDAARHDRLSARSCSGSRIPAPTRYFTFLPAGPPTLAFVKAYRQRTEGSRCRADVHRRRRDGARSRQYRRKRYRHPVHLSLRRVA